MPRSETPAPEVLPFAAPAALGSSRAGPPTGFTTPGAAFGFSGFAGFFGSGIAFAEGRTFSEGFSITGFAFGGGAGSAGAATGAGAGAAWGRPREAGLTTRTGKGHRDEDRRLARLAHEENEREEPRVRENRDGGREGARGEAGARAPREDVRDRERPGSASARAVRGHRVTERPRSGARSPFRGSRRRAG